MKNVMLVVIVSLFVVTGIDSFYGRIYRKNVAIYTDNMSRGLEAVAGANSKVVKIDRASELLVKVGIPKGSILLRLENGSVVVFPSIRESYTLWDRPPILTAQEIQEIEKALK